MKKIDARGLSCPAPVLLAKELIEKENPASLTILVDNAAARQNICRFLESHRFEVSVEPQGNEFQVTGRRMEAGSSEIPRTENPEPACCKIMVLAATDRMGFGDDELGVRLMINFIKTLKEMGPELWRLVFVNNGVKLTTATSPVLDILRDYEKNGLQILVCGTCLDHFNLLEQKQAGQTTNMLDIVSSMQLADKVITL
ncbi:MAG: sulfurtransferase-like selenium metabolism protein YedF [Thermodesulfobacteriota bacterium]